MVEPHGAVMDPEAERRALVLMRRVLSWAYKQRNGKFAIACLYHALGFTEADGVSMTEVAKRCGVGKAAVSKVCREIVEHFQVTPSRYMMSEESAKKFRLSNRRPVKIQ